MVRFKTGTLTSWATAPPEPKDLFHSNMLTFKSSKITGGPNIVNEASFKCVSVYGIILWVCMHSTLELTITKVINYTCVFLLWQMIKMSAGKKVHRGDAHWRATPYQIKATFFLLQVLKRKRKNLSHSTLNKANNSLWIFHQMHFYTCEPNMIQKQSRQIMSVKVLFRGEGASSCITHHGSVALWTLVVWETAGVLLDSITGLYNYIFLYSMYFAIHLFNL